MDEKKPLRILFITPYQPDLIHVRSYQFIRHLAKLGHSITLIYFDSKENAAPSADLKNLCEKIYPFELPRYKSLLNYLFTLPTKKPLQVMHGYQRKMYNQIHSLVGTKNRPFDAIHFEHIRSVNFGFKLLDEMPAVSIRCVWDSVDSITHLFTQAAQKHPRWTMRKLMSIETRRTSHYEPIAASKFKQVLVTSQMDKQVYSELLKRENLAANITILQNGVDLEYFSPIKTSPREADTLVISGKMSYHANENMVHKFMGEILPLIWQKKPDTKLWVVGQNPSPKILAYAQDRRIKITGWVEDIRPYLCRATASVAPLTYGAGIQNKILEAMSCETPVIASGIAAQALQAVDGEEILVADDSQQFANYVLSILSNQQLATKIGKAGRLYVEKMHSWEKAANDLENIYRHNYDQ